MAGTCQAWKSGNGKKTQPDPFFYGKSISEDIRNAVTYGIIEMDCFSFYLMNPTSVT
jgi:hypothetical protein